MCAAVLSLEAITLGLTTPVMITVADVDTGTALAVGLGLAVACLAGRRDAARRVGLRARLGCCSSARSALGVVVPLMFFLGSLFALLWGTAYFLGRKIERERAAAYAARRGRRDVTELSPTPRTTLTREKERGVSDRAELLALLREGLIAHVGVTVGDGADAPPGGPARGVRRRPGRSGPGRDALRPRVGRGRLAAAYAVRARSHRLRHGDRARRAGAGPVGVQPLHELPLRRGDRAGRGSSTTRRRRPAPSTSSSTTSCPGRAAALRPNTRKELAATSVLAVPLHEASLKTRAGGPEDDQPDIDAGYWAGHLPLRMVASPVVPDPAAPGPGARARAAPGRGAGRPAPPG